MTFAVVALVCVLVAVSAVEHPDQYREVDDEHASTKSYYNNGRYHSFTTNNGIVIKADIKPRNFGGNPPVVSDVAEGTFSWLSPDDIQKIITVKYTADEKGYLPAVLRSNGNKIPTKRYGYGNWFTNHYLI